MATLEQKKKLKEVLFGIATPEEKKELNALEASELNERLDVIAKHITNFLSENEVKNQNLGTVLATLLESVDATRRTTGKVSDRVSEKVEESFERLAGKLVDKLDELKQSNGQRETLTVPLYKTMIEGIAGVKKSIEDKPVPTWRWPQYASVSVRNKNFANVNPSVDAFNIGDYDEIDLTYSGSNIATVTYKLNNVTVATLTLSYSGSNLTKVIKS